MKTQVTIQQELPVALTDVPGLLPKRNGKKVHHSTIYRWTTKGARGRVLESRLIGGVRYTTVAALNRFLDTTVVQAEKGQAEALKRILYGT